MGQKVNPVGMRVGINREWESSKADFAVIEGFKVDKAGNICYHGTARNFCPLMATAAKTVIVEAENLVEIGEIDPDNVVTPGIFVDYIVYDGGNK